MKTRKKVSLRAQDDIDDPWPDEEDEEVDVKVEPDKFEKILRFETFTRDQLNALVKVLGPLPSMVCNIGHVDISKGRGVLHESNGDRCVWDKEKHRITIQLVSDGGIIASRSRTPDPNCPK